MMALNGNERELRKKIQKDVEIPTVVQDKMNQAYYMIESNSVVQKEAEKDVDYWLKLGGKAVGGVAAAFVIGFVFCAQNPVMAKNIPVVGSLFEFLQDKVSFFGDFADHAIPLENSDEVKTEDGMTISCNETNDAGIGLKTVIRTPYELTVNELYDENSDSDCFIVLLDADGNILPRIEVGSNYNNFAIQDRDISTVDIYFLDYVQYMTELKKQQNFDNPTKEDGQKWKNLLEKNAKYHKTLHFDR